MVLGMNGTGIELMTYIVLTYISPMNLRVLVADQHEI